MKASELLLIIGTHLEQDAEIKAWSNTNFGKDHTVYIGLDTESPPVESEYPLVIIFYVERLRGEGSRLQTFATEIGTGIFNKELIKPDESGSPNLKVYKGLFQVEDFRELVEESLFRAMPKIQGKVDVSGETTTDVFFPFFRSNTLISMEFIRTSRKPLGR